MIEEEKNINLKIKMHTPKDCAKCCMGKYDENCGFVAKDIFNVDCTEENCHFELIPNYTKCIKENVKIGDIVKRKMSDQQYIVRYIFDESFYIENMRVDFVLKETSNGIQFKKGTKERFCIFNDFEIRE